MLFQRQNSKINVLVTMGDEKMAQVVPTCVYDTDHSPRDGLFPDNFRTSTPTTQNNSANFRTDAIRVSNDQSEIQNSTVHVSSGANDFDFMDFTAAGGTDVKLADAAKRALIDGDMTPLIKEELKYSIQTKRMREGKQELKVEFTEPQPDLLTPEEEVRVEKRREQNRMAAQRFRERQKGKASYLQKQCQRLESTQTELRYELEKVRQERDELRRAFDEHMAMCPLQFTVQYYTSTSTGENT